MSAVWFVCLLAAVAVVAAQEAEQAAKPCCFPKKLEGFVAAHSRATVGRRSRRGESMTRFSIDYAAGKVAVSGIARAGRRVVNFTAIADFGAKKLYLADRRRQKCRVVPLKNAMPDSCAPLANATYRRSFTMGAGSGALNLDVWTVKAKRRGAMVVASIVVQKGNCAPVMEEAMGRVRRTRFRKGKMFADLSLKIKDPKVFTPPSYCKSGAMEKLMMIGGPRLIKDLPLKWGQLIRDVDTEASSDELESATFSDDLQYILEAFTDE